MELKVGTEFYKVIKANNSLRRKRITSVINGVEWYRYDTPLITCSVWHYKILGILTKHLEGEWTEREAYLETDYCIERLDDGKVYGMTFETDDSFFKNDEIFENKDVAEIVAKEMEYEENNKYND